MLEETNKKYRTKGSELLLQGTGQRLIYDAEVLSASL